MNDTELKDFFHNHRPETTDSGAFMSSLNAKLDAIEKVKRIRDAELAHYKKMTFVAFACGLSLGAAVIATFIFNPSVIIPMKPAVIAEISAFISEWKDQIMIVFAVIVTTLGLIPWEKFEKRTI